MKKSKLLKIFIVIFIFIISVLLYTLFYYSNNNDPEKIKLKTNYSLKEIIDKIQKNYFKIETIQMTFSDTWIDERKINNTFQLHIKKAKLYNSLLQNKLKIKTKGIELIRDKDFKIWGNYKTRIAQKKYYQLISWLISVYESVLFLPLKIDFKKIVESDNITVKKLKGNQYYHLLLTLNRNIKINLTINMYYGIAEKINIIEKIKIKDKLKGEFYYPYIIKAELANIKKFNDIYFPQDIKVKYISRNDKFTFYTKIKKIKFNKKIHDKNLVLQNEKNEVTWYSDPHWINNNELVMIKGTGREIKNIYADIKIKDKNFYIITKNIKKDKDKVIKHLLFSKEKEIFSKFIFSAHYNKKYDKLAYSIFPTGENTNQEIDEINGTYLYDFHDNKTIKISDKGFLPLWSNKEEYLIWNESPAVDPGINMIWICNKKGGNKKLLIKNGFHYNWGKNDKCIVFERGYWIYGKGYNIFEGLSIKKILSGIYLYEFDNQNIKVLNDTGFNPRISKNKEKLIFSDQYDNSGIYLMNLKDFKINQLIKTEKTDKVLNAYWYNNEILFIKTTGPDITKYGLYKYSIKKNNYELLSNRIGIKDKFIYHIDSSINNNNYLLYKLYKLPDYSYSMWGIFNFNKRKIHLEDCSFL